MQSSLSSFAVVRKEYQSIVAISVGLAVDNPGPASQVVFQ